MATKRTPSAPGEADKLIAHQARLLKAPRIAAHYHRLAEQGSEACWSLEDYLGRRWPWSPMPAPNPAPANVSGMPAFLRSRQSPTSTSPPNPPTSVPSGGGHWAVQGPIAVGSALAIGQRSPAYLGLISMAVAVGEGVANMIQPFWLLPLLAIAKLNVRQVTGFTIVAFVIGLVVLGATALIAPYVI